MLTDLAIAPQQMLAEFSPVIECSLHDPARHCGEVVAGILDHVGQLGTQYLGASAEHEAELRQQTSDLIDAVI